MALPQPCREIKYHWPLNNTEVKGTDTLTGWKFKLNLTLQKLNAAKLEGSEPWVNTLQLKKAPPDIWSCPASEISKSKWWGQEAGDFFVDCFPLDQDFILQLTWKLFSFFFPSLWSWPGKVTPSIYYLPASAKEGNLSDCWICHKKVWSIQKARDPLVFPVTNFSSLPKHYNVTTPSSLKNLVYQVQLLGLEHPVPFTFLHL